uniref:hypothetical protein n=1 Tax=Pseudonocardia sp. CA-138482 TaxID=3240023 RepID=UPI003F496F15
MRIPQPPGLLDRARSPGRNRRRRASATTGRHRNSATHPGHGRPGGADIDPGTTRCPHTARYRPPYRAGTNSESATACSNPSTTEVIAVTSSNTPPTTTHTPADTRSGGALTAHVPEARAWS